MIIRPIEKKDLAHGFQETLENLRSVGNLTIEQMETLLESIKQNHKHLVFVAVEDDEVVGSITLLIEQKFIREGGKVGHIEDVVTRLGWQGKGIGKQLVQHAIDEARRQHCYKVILDCNKDNVGFYQKLGFIEHEIEMRFDL